MCADQEGSVARSRLDAVLQVLVEKNDTERWVNDFTIYVCTFQYE